MPLKSPKSSFNESSTENLANKMSLSTASTTTLHNNEHQYIERHENIRPESLIIKKTPWPSIICAAGLGFCSAVQFSMYISSVFPYLQTLDSNVTEQFFGLVVASYSLGQIIAAPALGWWSNKIKNVRVPLTFCLLAAFSGNLVYIVAQLFPRNSGYLILFARFIVGMSAGNISILKSYVSMASNHLDRSRAIALMTGGIATGSMSGPAIQLIFTPIGYPGIKITDNLLLNIYTFPAVGACTINLVGLCFLWCLFKEEYAGLVEHDKTEREDKKLPKPDLIALLVVHITLFAQRFTFTNIETLSAPIGQSIFAWTRPETVVYIGLAHSIVSALALLVDVIFVVFKMEKIINFRRHCMLAVFGLMLFHLFTFNWPFLPGNLKTYTQKEYDFAESFNGSELSGCNTDKFSWCNSTKQLNVWVYYASYVLFIGICFPSINITLNTLFSKILGPRRIAAQQGMLQMTGSFARLTGPIMISQAYANFGPRLSWIVELIVLSIALIFWFKFYRRMIPLDVHKNRTTNIKSKVALVSPSIKPVDDDLNKNDKNLIKVSAL